MLQRLKQFGPGLLVAAAFIGPGTVTTASVAGAQTGYALLWALVFSIFATLVLQEMSARLGLVARLGLGAALRQSIDTPLLRWAALYPRGGTGWFDLASWPRLATMARALETRPAAIAAARAEGLGDTPFSAPRLATPPEGTAT